MSQKVVFKTLYQNLKLLGFQNFLRLSLFDKKFDRLQFNELMFEKPNEKAFEMVTFFLFSTLDKENKKRFNGCFPCYDRKQEADFRKGATECFRELEKQHDSQIKFLPVFLHNPGGVQFCNLYVSLSNYVLAKVMRKRFHFEENYSQLDDQQIKATVNDALQTHDKNEEQLVKLKSFWEAEAKYFIERHRKLCKEVQDIEMSINESAEVLNMTVLLEEILKLQYDWDLLYFSAFKLTTECKKQLKVIDEDLESSFDAMKITNETKGTLDLCDMFRSSEKPIENFFEHINSMSTLKLRDVHSHITLARAQMVNNNVAFIEMNKKIRNEDEALNEGCKKLRSDLLSHEAVKKRKEWFKQRLPTIFPKLVFEPQKAESISFLQEESPKPMFEQIHRMSNMRYSFQFGDISTLHYVPPPAMEESCILSPVKENKSDCNDSFVGLEKEELDSNLVCD